MSPDAFPSAGVALVDMNEDGKLDAVFANSSDRNNRVCLGTGTGGFTCANVSSDAFPSAGVAIGDVDNDQKLDAVFANASDRKNRICFGNGAGGFTSCQDANGNSFTSTAVALGKVDGDNNLKEGASTRSMRYCRERQYSRRARR